MNLNACPISESPFTHFAWPEDHQVGLVLDGVAIPRLGEKIYQWGEGQVGDAECLYAVTRWEVVSEVSPWLVWLEGPEDPILGAFLDRGPEEEAGYLLVSAVDRASCTRWMRAHLQVEVARGIEDLMRIAHPALARSVLGENLSGCPAGVVDRVIVPDRISRQWVSVESPASQAGRIAKPIEKVVVSPELTAAFDAFNQRQRVLQVWSSLDDSMRNQIGGPDLQNAYPKLQRLLSDALDNGHDNLRAMMHYLFAEFEQQPDIGALPEAT
jgi:hypothetical protein